MSEGRVSREDLEAKVREIQESLSGAARNATRSAVPFVVAIVLVLLGISYYLGRRSGRRRPVIVELKRS